jgi:uncharacterized membrane-anchored protein
MVMTPSTELKLDDKPLGKPETVASIAPIVLYVIGVIGVFSQTVWLFVPGAEVRVMAVLGRTMMVPVAITSPQWPVTSTL